MPEDDDDLTHVGLRVEPDGGLQLMSFRDAYLDEDLGQVIGGLLGIAACADPVNHFYFRDVSGPEEADTDPGLPNRTATELAGSPELLRGTIVFLGGPAEGPETRDADLAALGVEVDE